MLAARLQHRFLNADAAEEVYVKMTPGCEEFDENGVPLVMRLLKSLYGLRQSPTNWWNTIDEHLVEIGFKVSSRAPASAPNRRATPFYPDPVRGRRYIARKRPSGAEVDQAESDETFSMTEMGDTSLVLGMGVTLDRQKGTVTITQEKYTKSLLEQYGMSCCNSTYTPGVGK